jgi:hypothetical protein
MFYFVDFEQVMNKKWVFEKTRRKDRTIFDPRKLFIKKTVTFGTVFFSGGKLA